MSSTRIKIAILQANYTSLFLELNAESKCVGENFKFWKCEPDDIFNLLLKMEKYATKSYFFLYKEGKKKHYFK